jgi:(S)-sulfolactate dehydrogenase
MGVVGFGSIGRLVSDLVRPLGMRVLAFDPALSPTDQAFTVHHAQHCARLDDLLQQADAISLHVPLNDQTRHLINAQRIALMKPTAVLVNTARGGVIDEAALVEAIRDKKLGGAALDVFEREPLPSGVLPHDLPQLILTPHIAGLTQEANERVSTMIAERVTAALKQ